MKRKRHRPEQIIRKLRDAEADLAAGLEIGAICQKLGVSEATFHRWRNQYGGMKAEEMKRLKELQKENARLRPRRRARSARLLTTPDSSSSLKR